MNGYLLLVLIGLLVLFVLRSFVLALRASRNGNDTSLDFWFFGFIAFAMGCVGTVLVMVAFGDSVLAVLGIPFVILILVGWLGIIVSYLEAINMK